MSKERKEIENKINQIKEDHDVQVIWIRINKKKIMVFCVKRNPQPNEDWLKDSIEPKKMEERK